MDQWNCSIDDQDQEELEGNSKENPDQEEEESEEEVRNSALFLISSLRLIAILINEF